MLDPFRGVRTISHRQLAGVLLSLGCLLPTFMVYGEGQARAQYQNPSSELTDIQQQYPGVIFYGGYIKAPGDTQNGDVILQESAFGQPFSEWYPSDTYGSEVVASVITALYPTEEQKASRVGIEGSGKPFRYKWLLYDGTGTDVTAFDPSTFETLFTQADRDIIADQIEILKEAVAASPLDTSLRDTLLDVYYDLAVAEMQATKPLLARLASLRLGIEELSSPEKFIIDEEISTYEEIATTTQAAIDQFASLLVSPLFRHPCSI